MEIVNCYAKEIRETYLRLMCLSFNRRAAVAAAYSGDVVVFPAPHCSCPRDQCGFGREDCCDTL